MGQGINQKADIYIAAGAGKEFSNARALKSSTTAHPQMIAEEYTGSKEQDQDVAKWTRIYNQWDLKR